MMNPRPLSRKKTIQILVALTLLAWATQTLFQQWGFGQEQVMAVPDVAALAEPLAPEKFVPGTPRFAAGATLEIRAEATVVGSEVKLRQIARWSKSDEAIFAPLADLVIVRLAPKTPFRGISVEEIKGTLHDAGVNLAVIKIAGATSCTVGRSDVEYDESVALQQWIDARQAAAEISADDAPVAAPVEPPATAPAADPPANNYKTLRDVLLADLSSRTDVAIEDLQVNFLARGERLLNLCEPHFRFTVEPRRAKTLGDVSWNVEISSDGSSQKATIDAYVRAWQRQVVLSRPLAHRQIIQQSDLIERRTLAEEIEDEPLLNLEQIVGQQAARDLKPGTIMTARTIEAVPLVRTGQLVTIVLQRGGVEIKTVARATENGAFGQTIRVKNELTRDVFEVTVTGLQTARLGEAAEPPQNVASISGE